MDDKGYAFTPLAFLLIIPVMLLAVSYGDITNEINSISTIAIGGDVTHATAVNIISSLDKGASDAGRRASYSATRQVIDSNGTFFTNGKSKEFVEGESRKILNDYVKQLCQNLEDQSGRQIYINDNLITDITTDVFLEDDVTIEQDDPFGFYVKIKGGIPIKVVENNQTFEGTIPPIRSYVSLEGMEDPYIWANTKFRNSTIIYKFPYYHVSTTGAVEYHFADSPDSNKLHYLWECLIGSGNPSKLTRSYYFYDPDGLSFFDRLENRTPGNSLGPNRARMSTFILEDPLYLDNNGTVEASSIDHEYFANITGVPIKVNGAPIRKPNLDGTPDGNILYLSPKYVNKLGLGSYI